MKQYLAATYDINMFSQHIDDLPFTFVPPLGSKYYRCLMFQLRSRFFSRWTLNTIKTIVDRHVLQIKLYGNLHYGWTIIFSNTPRLKTRNLEIPANNLSWLILTTHLPYTDTLTKTFCSNHRAKLRKIVLEQVIINRMIKYINIYTID